jgi:hypothetical protein
MTDSKTTQEKYPTLRTHRAEIEAAVCQVLQANNYVRHTGERSYFTMKIGAVLRGVDRVLSGLEPIPSIEDRAAGKWGYCTRFAARSSIRTVLEALADRGLVDKWEGSGKGSPILWCWVEDNNRRYTNVARRLRDELWGLDLDQYAPLCCYSSTDYVGDVEAAASAFGAAYGEALAQLDTVEMS